jgi:hypothetical protein
MLLVCGVQTKDRENIDLYLATAICLSCVLPFEGRRLSIVFVLAVVAEDLKFELLLGH